MKKRINIALCLVGICSLQACKHEPDLAGIPDISFATEIQPIIGGNCSSSGCHSNDNQSEFSLVGYDDVINNGDVKPGNASDSKLYEVLFATGERKMPPNGDLSDLQKKK